jgi:hypothetical protein
MSSEQPTHDRTPKPETRSTRKRQAGSPDGKKPRARKPRAAEGAPAPAESATTTPALTETDTQPVASTTAAMPAVAAPNVIVRHEPDWDDPPATPAALHRWVRQHLDVQVPLLALSPGSVAPFAYIEHAFFEGTTTRHPPDCVVWANRGGGKTFLGAVATALDLLFKPGVEVRILGGSLEQSERMFAHLRRLFERPALAQRLGDRRGAVTGASLRLDNGSSVEILAQSQRAVRGTRVQKLRCDEADLFDREVWEAAQLTTRSLRRAGPWGPWVRGSIEALSTMHRPHGLMWDIVTSARAPLGSHAGQPGAGGGDAGKPTGEGLATGEGQATRDGAITGGLASSDDGRAPGDGARADRSAAAVESAALAAPRRTLFRWGVVDVLESCPSERACEPCVLRGECAGRAKTRRAEQAGHLTVDDAATLKGRVGSATWESEMLCLRPRREDSVLPEFVESVHVMDDAPAWAVGAGGLGGGTSDAGAGDAAGGVPSAGGVGVGGAVRWRGGERLIVGMDFGFRSPAVVLWALVDGEGVIRVVDERIASGVRLAAHIEAIHAHPLGRPEYVGADPAGHQRHEQTGVSNITALRRSGLTVRSRKSELSEGLGLIRDRLAPATGSPRLFISRRCQRLIESLARYRYPEGRLHVLEPMKDGHDHAVDALRYMILNEDRPQRAHCGSYLAG